MAGKILIVDDEEMVRRVLVEIITRMGFECLYAKNGEEAIQLLREKNSIQLLLLDINMPKVDGITVLKEIKNYTHCHDLYIIVMTGDHLRYRLDAILQIGGNDLMYKHLELNELKKKTND